MNCAAIPAALWESEFFGHERGAFTGAATRRTGRFELANGGTIFLDEVAELPLELQPKLLRVLQEGEYEPVGSSQTRKTDARVIAATNRDLSEEVAAGQFREDLYYRLHVFPIPVPPLRDRDADVEVLAQNFLARNCTRMGKPALELTADCLRRLRSYHWPGNVRELENVIERAVIIARDGRLQLARRTAAAPRCAGRRAQACGRHARSAQQRRVARNRAGDVAARARRNRMESGRRNRGSAEAGNSAFDADVANEGAAD